MLRPGGSARMRVMLIRPPCKHTVESEVPEAVSTKNLSSPPLALMSIAQFLKSHSRHEVTILDAQLDDLAYDELERRVREFAPDVVGITAFTVQLVDVHHTVACAKKAGA